MYRSKQPKYFEVTVCVQKWLLVQLGEIFRNRECKHLSRIYVPNTVYLTYRSVKLQTSESSTILIDQLILCRRNLNKSNTLSRRRCVICTFLMYLKYQHYQRYSDIEFDLEHLVSCILIWHNKPHEYTAWVFNQSIRISLEYFE
jgi:hypothetical protein